MQPSNATQARSIAEELFGHESLLPGQEESIVALLEGHDVLLISPTGSGKSLTYQVAGMLLPGVTVVVSPLLALQHDQVQRLAEAGPAVLAGRLSSAESDAAKQEVLSRARSGELQFVFLSPEQLANDALRGDLLDLAPGLVAVDEAHCVSSWGHDFRPDYQRLGELIAQLGAPRVIAMTATASPPVREDIVASLALRDPRVVATGVARRNLALDVRRATGSEEQHRVVVELAAEKGRLPGIVYCRTRRASEEYAAELHARGLRVAAYHAGLAQKRRAATQDRFMAGELDLVVATSAFGLGIDKPDIRSVVHAQVPESPDTYYQEVGRAGRDGAPAEATLVYRPEDLALGRFFSPGVPRREAVAAVLTALSHSPDVDPAAIREATGLGPRVAGRIRNLVADVEAAGAHPVEVEDVVARAEALRQLERSRVEMMRGYAETDRCRMEFLVAYFGDRLRDLCGHCDNCRAELAEPPPEEDALPWALQSRVAHETFGSGLVTDHVEDEITVLFDEAGYRTLSRKLVEEKELLEPL